MVEENKPLKHLRDLVPVHRELVQRGFRQADFGLDGFQILLMVLLLLLGERKLLRTGKEVTSDIGVSAGRFCSKLAELSLSKARRNCLMLLGSI